MSTRPASAPAVVILAGGLGTRLRSVLTNLPKPMAPVGGRPFLERLVEQCRRTGLGEIVLCVGYRADAIEAHFGDGRDFGVRLSYAHEKELLGTAGALVNALPHFHTDTFVAMNGDSYCAVDLTAVLEAHRRTAADATLVAVAMPDCSRYGTLTLSPDDLVLGFNEKNPLAQAGMINAGIYVLQRRLLEAIPPGQSASLERTVFPSLCARGGLRAFRTRGEFIDIGVPAELERAQTWSFS